MVHRAHWRLAALLMFTALSATSLFAAHAEAQSNTGFVFDGRAVQTDGTSPLLSSNVTFTLSITGADGASCIVYQETQTADLSISDGYFSLQVGSGTTTALNAGHSMPAVFDLSATTVTGKDTSGNACTIAGSELRRLKVNFTDHASGNDYALSPAIPLGAAPYANVAHSLGGKAASEFMQKNSAQGVTQTNLESVFSRYAALDSILSGTYSGTASSATTANTCTTATTATNVSGTVAIANGGTGSTTAATARTALGLGALATMSPTGTANSTTYLRGDGTWAAASGGAVTSVASKTGAVTLTSADLTDFATAVDSRADTRADSRISTYMTANKAAVNGLATLDASGKVPSTQLSLGASDIPSLDWSKITTGKPTTLSGYAITDAIANAGGVASFKAGVDASKPGAGSIGAMYVATDTQKLYRDNGTTWDVIASNTGTGGTITGVTAGTGLTGGGASGGVTLGLSNVGTAGTYTKVTTDAQGRVTAGTNPTTLAGYGITDSLVANGGNTPSVQSGLDASLPAFGTAGRLYVATDAKKIYRDTGSAWVVISSVDASDLSAGTLSAARLPAFTGDVTSSAGSNSLTLGTVPLTKGGTGLTAAGGANKVLGMNNAGTAAEYKDITAGSGVSVTHSAGGIQIAATGSGGTVTSVGVAVPAYMTSTGGPVTGSGSITLGFGSQTAKQVFAAPSGAAGAPTFRNLFITDIFSTNSGSFLNTAAACSTGTALTYISATDHIECASLSLTSLQVTTALGFTPANGTNYVAKAGDTMTGTLTLPSNGLIVGTNQLVASSGRVGIGLTSPATVLDVAGAVRIGNDASGCAAALAGAVRYNSGSIEFCNGTVWGTLSGGAGGDVTTTGTQTITGDKTFSGTNTYSGPSSFTGYATFSSVGPAPAVSIDGGGLTVTSGGINISGLGITDSGNIFGSTAPSTNLRIDSTSDSSKGDILLAPNGGNVGIGTSIPRAALDVNGAITGPPAIDNGSDTTIDFSKGNMQYTTLDCQTFTLHNLKSGGTYMLVVQGMTSSTCDFSGAFSQNNDGSDSLYVHMPPDHGQTIANTHTIYNFAVFGSDVYVSWTPGYPP